MLDILKHKLIQISSIETNDILLLNIIIIFNKCINDKIIVVFTILDFRF